MEDQSGSASDSKPKVHATLRLGAELFSVNSEAGILSEQLISMKEKSMRILKDYITKHNAPNDVPDEPVEGSSEEEIKELDSPPKKSRMQK